MINKYSSLGAKWPRRTRRETILARYSCVANDLPDWAKEVLNSKMGSITVHARESFEIYLLNLKGITPKGSYVYFCKRFAEIFEKKASITLRKIKRNRENHEDFHISNDYFWQEFSSLFTSENPIKHQVLETFFEFQQFFKITYYNVITLFKRMWKGMVKTAKFYIFKPKISGKKIESFNTDLLHGK